MKKPLIFSIEPASWHDINELYQLEKECFKQDRWVLLDLIAALILPGIVRLKATVDGQMIGFIAGDSKSDKSVGWINTLGVLPVYRRQGVASNLLAACEAQIDVGRIRLYVRRSNQDALKLYEKSGYRRAGIKLKYYARGEDAFILEKSL